MTDDRPAAPTAGGGGGVASPITVVGWGGGR
jgi:hypothetical protein